MWEGVAVLAAADGVVEAVRDGMPDINIQNPQALSVDGRECGNGVRLRHADGFITQYCHLREDSVAVTNGDRVARGDTLGLVGMSGDSSFPHVHMQVNHEGQVIDPFLGLIEPEEPCALGEATLWDEPLAAMLVYQPIILRNLGFANGPVEWSDVEAGTLRTPPTTIDGLQALVIAFDGFSIKAGDVIEARIDGPDNWQHYNREVVENDKASFFRFTGRRAPDTGFAAGMYRASVTISREGNANVVNKRNQYSLTIGCDSIHAAGHIHRYAPTLTLLYVTS